MVTAETAVVLPVLLLVLAAVVAAVVVVGVRSVAVVVETTEPAGLAEPIRGLGVAM